MIPRRARVLVPAVLCLGLAVPLPAAGAGCGLVATPAPGHRQVRVGDPKADVRVYGDSITFQARRLLAARHPEIAIDAFWGRGTRSAVDAVLDDAAARMPKVVVLAVGTNDFGAPDEFQRQALRVRSQLPQGTRVLWVLAYDDKRTGWVDIDARASAVPRVEVVDWVEPNLQARGANARSPLLSDGRHLSCRGGPVWVDLVDHALVGLPAAVPTGPR